MGGQGPPQAQLVPLPHPGGQPHHLPLGRGYRKSCPYLALSAKEPGPGCTMAGPGSEEAR